MSDLLIMQSFGTPPDGCERYLALSERIHRSYAEKCGADYELFIGEKEPGVHPAWNRIPMFLEALRSGYTKVVWLDADTLVVDPARSIFEGTDDTTPLHMCRTNGFPWPPHVLAREQLWEAYNDGVLVVNNTPIAIDALEYVWSERRAEHPTLGQIWELSPLLDWLLERRDVEGIVAELDPRWNWMPFAENLDFEDEAAIKAWHGMPHAQRFSLFRQEVERIERITA